MKEIQNKKGFTLVELLLVMAIIGILAGIIMVGMSSSRKRAKVSSALKTANGVVAELAHCYLNNKTVIPWNNAHTGGNAICSGAGDWPELSDGCNYGNYSSANVLVIDCSTTNGAIITCDVTQGNCDVTYP